MAWAMATTSAALQSVGPAPSWVCSFSTQYGHGKCHSYGEMVTKRSGRPRCSTTSMRRRCWRSQ
eukprot:11922943-Heterocapsa_arctica.AAC.5